MKEAADPAIISEQLEAFVESFPELKWCLPSQIYPLWSLSTPVARVAGISVLCVSGPCLRPASLINLECRNSMAVDKDR
jgi:hypothetical protein